jgi:hypothetical protein
MGVDTPKKQEGYERSRSQEKRMDGGPASSMP